MTTLRAILLHMLIGAGQAGITQVSQLGLGGQIAAQAAALTLQAVIAKKNSETDTRGNQLLGR